MKVSIQRDLLLLVVPGEACLLRRGACAPRGTCAPKGYGEATCASAQRCNRACFRRDLHFPWVSSSGGLRLEALPKISAIKARFFRQSLQFSSYPSSRRHFIAGLPKVDIGSASVAISIIFFRTVTISSIKDALGIGSLEINAIWFPVSIFDSLWCENHSKSSSMGTETAVFDDPVPMDSESNLYGNRIGKTCRDGNTHSCETLYHSGTTGRRTQIRGTAW